MGGSSQISERVGKYVMFHQACNLLSFDAERERQGLCPFMSFENDIRLVFVTKPSRKQNLFFSI